MRIVEDPMQALEAIKKSAEAERARAEQARMSFVVADDATLVANRLRANSPIIHYMGWSATVPQGGTLSFTVGVFNPDPAAPAPRPHRGAALASKTGAR